ncbi:caspase family protein [Shewanella atlantica]|uniref:Caspase family protein n=1 Tax=Shewanella atlantica TaxID=271099 RepID=A0A3S0KS83_9GAMM|nr:caspase family protein [Shewanella atlantica]RTR33205.1 caspase family protein [Shewanella atlantica]
MRVSAAALCVISFFSSQAFASTDKFIYQDLGKPNICGQSSATVWDVNGGELIVDGVPEVYQGAYVKEKNVTRDVSTIAILNGENPEVVNQLRMVANPACGTEPTFERINLLAQYYRQQSTNIDPSLVPAEISPPDLPLPPVIEKDQFETKVQFQARVNLAMAERDKLIASAQQKYRSDVTARNNLLEELTRRQSHLVGAATDNPIYFYGQAFQAVMGKPVFTPKSYDAERQVMFFDFKAETADYKHSVAVNVPQQQAKAVFNAAELYEPQLHYEMEGDSLKLTAVSLKVGEETFKGSQTDESFQAESISVALVDDKKIDTDGIQLKLQNPNLVDKFQLKAVMQQSETELGDELLTQLSSVDAIAEDKTKWLFNIAIEKYDNTDDVIYSRRSGEAVSLAANKLLGVPQRHIYALYDEQATSGAIKDKLKLMLSHVKPQDTVYFYYNGHGIPALPDNDPYILPHDKIPDFIKDDSYFRLNNIYQLLSKSNAKSVVAFVDSCFSGATDGVSVIKGVAASRLVPKKVGIDDTKMAVLTAGRNKEYSNMYADKGHRLFSYYLVQEWLNGTRQLTELHNVVSGKVQARSFEMGDLKQQHPEMYGNPNITL